MAARASESTLAHERNHLSSIPHFDPNGAEAGASARVIR
jgi:hypothetical protein